MPYSLVTLHPLRTDGRTTTMTTAGPLLKDGRLIKWNKTTGNDRHRFRF